MSIYARAAGWAMLALLTPFFSASAQALSHQATQGQPLAALGWYADPEVHIFAGQYWIYPTASSVDPKDAATPDHFNAQQTALRAQKGLRPAYLKQTFFDAFSSPDLVHWTRHPHVLDVSNVPWAAYAVWAPSVIELHGHYYIFFGANDIQKNTTEVGGIGLAVSDNPGGPFKDALGKPFIGAFHDGAQPIDPMVYRDDDGQIYLYFGGQGHCIVAKLSPDLKHIVPFDNGQDFKEITPPNYVEGSFMIKRDGVYYFMWSEGDWGDSSYGVSYAKSDSPTGPFTRPVKILGTDPNIAAGAGHHSVLHIPGTDEWYIVYHRHPLGNTNPNERLLAIDRLRFDAQGNIEPIKMTRDGVPARPLPPSAR